MTFLCFLEICLNVIACKIVIDCDWLWLTVKTVKSIVKGSQLFTKEIKAIQINFSKTSIFRIGMIVSGWCEL